MAATTGTLVLMSAVSERHHLKSIASRSMPFRAMPADDNGGSRLRPPDSRLLPPTPGRSGPRPVSLRNVASGIVTEFGLQVNFV